MVIKIKPSDIIKRCLWNEYKRFCLSGKNENYINEFIIQDDEFELTENDAYVIGLLKVVETDNLVHRFKIYIEDLLKTRSNLFDNKLFINKNVILNEVKDFKNRFPKSYKPSFEYKVSIEELNEKIDGVYSDIQELKVFTKIIKEKTYNFVLSSSIKDLLN
jgi:hypothetical protein